MNVKSIMVLILALLLLGLTACTAAGSAVPTLAAATAAPSDGGTGTPDSVPARPGSGATKDPSAQLADLIEISGTVKEVNEALVLMELCDGGGEFMLRLSENTGWADGVDREFAVGNAIKCLVKPEPTLAPPSQGEVFEVLENKAAG